MREFINAWTQNRVALVLMLMGTYSVQSLLITASKQRGGEYSYNATAAVLLAEALKLVFAISMLTPKARAELNPRGSLVFAVPAVLYTLQNRLVFEALRYISPPQYQLFNNMKLFSTSLVYRVIMQRQIRLVQWLALLLLGLGMSLVTDPPQPPCTSSGSENIHESQPVYQLWIGFGIMAMVAWCSALAGVLNEWLIKQSASVLEANTWLYVYGVLASAVALGTGGWSELLSFQGFGTTTWLVVLCNALLGQTVAYLFRYADSIVKIYAVCAAMAFTTLMSIFFFGFRLRFEEAAGYGACAISVCLYYAPPDVLIATDTELIQGLLAWKGKSAPSKQQ